MARKNTVIDIKPAGVAVLSVLLFSGVFFGIALPRMMDASQEPATLTPSPAPPAVDVALSSVTEAAPARPGAPLLTRGETVLDAGDPAQLTVTIGAPTRIAVLQANPAEFWKAQTSVSLNTPLRIGDPLHLHLRARSSTSNPIFLVLEKSGPPFTKDLAHRVELTPDWKTIDLQFDANQDHPAGDASLRLQVGEKVGQIDVADLELRRR